MDPSSATAIPAQARTPIPSLDRAGKGFRGQAAVSTFSEVLQTSLVESGGALGSAARLPSAEASNRVKSAGINSPKANSRPQVHRPSIDSAVSGPANMPGSEVPHGFELPMPAVAAPGSPDQAPSDGTSSTKEEPLATDLAPACLLSAPSAPGADGSIGAAMSYLPPSQLPLSAFSSLSSAPPSTGVSQDASDAPVQAPTEDEPQVLGQIVAPGPYTQAEVPSSQGETKSSIDSSDFPSSQIGSLTTAVAKQDERTEIHTDTMTETQTAPDLTAVPAGGVSRAASERTTQTSAASPFPNIEAPAVSTTTASANAVAGEGQPKDPSSVSPDHMPTSARKTILASAAKPAGAAVAGAQTVRARNTNHSDRTDSPLLAANQSSIDSGTTSRKDVPLAENLPTAPLFSEPSGPDSSLDPTAHKLFFPSDLSLQSKTETHGTLDSQKSNESDGPFDSLASVPVTAPAGNPALLTSSASTTAGAIALPGAVPYIVPKTDVSGVTVRSSQTVSVEDIRRQLREEGPELSPGLQAWNSGENLRGNVTEASHLATKLGPSEMNIAMQAEALGAVQVRTRVTGDQMGASITVERHDAHAFLTSDLPSLRQALSDRQLHLEDISVSQGSPLSGAGIGDSGGRQPMQEGSTGALPYAGTTPSAAFSGAFDGPTVADILDTRTSFDSNGRLSVRA